MIEIVTDESSPTSEYIPALNGAFAVVTYAMNVLMFKNRKSGKWELPGGGEEDVDEGDLAKTACRETAEEALTRILPEDVAKIAELIQRVPKRGPDVTGTVMLFRAQVFCTRPSTKLKRGRVWNRFTNHAATSEEASLIRFIPVSEIFGGEHDVDFAHQRMILHWLNWESKPGQTISGIRLGEKVTAEVPNFGSVTV